MGKLRELRTAVKDALAGERWPECLERLAAKEPKTLLGPLFACLLDRDPLLRWRAATAFGLVTERLFEASPADARELVRQLLWRLNEESGNVAWGIPEAFGEILAAQPVLAREFHRVLCSYINERDCDSGDNYLELAPLRRGVYWALARLAEKCPELALPALDDLLAALGEDDSESRGLAALAVGRLLPLAGKKSDRARQALRGAAEDGAFLTLYRDGHLEATTVGALACEGLPEKVLTGFRE